MGNKLSIIIPCKDRAKNTVRLLNTLKGQAKKYPQTEIIVIENNSTEDMSFLDSYPFLVKHVKCKNCGEARNIGLDLATGDYICFIDNDDYISSDYLSSIYEVLPEKKDWYVFQWFIDGKYNDLKNLDMENPLKETWALWSYCFNRKLFEGVRFNDEQVGSDLLIFSIITNDTIGQLIKKPLYYFKWNNNENSLSHRHARGEI